MGSPAAAAGAESFVLAVDLGTGGPKVGLVSLSGAVAWRDHVRIETRLLPGGGAVQDAAQWWDVIADRARVALASGAVAPERVVAVSCTGMWACTVPVDSDGRPVGDALLWMDTRGGPHTRRAVGGPVSGYAPLSLLQWVRRSGGAPSLAGADPIGHMLHLEHDRPDVARAARWYLEAVDYLSMRFTGEATASHASMAGAWLTDNRRLRHLAYDPELVRRAGVPATKLPPLRPSASVVGTVAAPVARALGLAPTTAVVAGTPDLHSAAAGSGAVQRHRAHLTVSSTSWISCPVDEKRTDVRRQIAAVPGLGQEDYLLADNHETAGLCLEWLRDGALGMAGAPYDAVTALAATSAPGAGGVLFTPWLAGERSPVDAPEARGGFHNLSLSTTRADLARAVLEGVAHNDRWLHGAVEHVVGTRLDPVRILGGGARSDLWCQIHADVMDRTIERVADPVDANLRGAALLAGLALGRITRDDVSDLVHVDAVFRPDPTARSAYAGLHRALPDLFRAQRPLFRRLNRGKARPTEI
jgi:xylulokinase